MHPRALRRIGGSVVFWPVLLACIGFAFGLSMGWLLRAKVEMATESEPEAELRQLKSRQVIYAAKIRSLFLELAHHEAKLASLRAAGVDTERVPDAEPVIDSRLASIIGALDQGDGEDDDIHSNADHAAFMSILPDDLADEHEATVLGSEPALTEVDVVESEMLTGSPDPTRHEVVSELAEESVFDSDPAGGGRLARMVADALASEARRGGDARDIPDQVEEDSDRIDARDLEPSAGSQSDVPPAGEEEPAVLAFAPRVGEAADDESEDVAVPDESADDEQPAVALSLIGDEEAELEIDLRGPDDLTRIKGIGPKLAGVVNEAGITTFAELASLDEEGIERLSERLGSFKNRIRRDDWVGSAQRLLEEEAVAAGIS